MVLAIKVIYENGVFRPVEPVDLPEGQSAVVTLEAARNISEDAAIRAALGDSVRWHNPDDDTDAWVEDMAGEIEEAFKGLKPLSEIIIEERGEQL